MEEQQRPDPMNSASENDRDLLVRVLYDQQERLRAEVEDLRRRQESNQDKDKEQQGEKKDEEKGKEQKEEQGKDGDKEKKPPLKDRAFAWKREHPFGALLVIVGAVLLVVGSMMVWRYLESYENTDDAFVDGHTDPISPRISGFVTAVYVENTYRVRKGQVLIRLDRRDYQVAREQANASLAQAVAAERAQSPNVPITTTTQSTAVVNANLGVESATASLTAAEEKYRSAMADLHQAEVSESNAAREEQRYRLLVVKEEVSRELYDQRETDEKAQSQLVASRRETADAAAKAVTQAEAALHQAQQQAEEVKHNMPRQVAIQNETLAMRHADMLTAKAKADQAELNFGYTNIVAPEDGIIGDKSVQVGMQVQPGQELCALTQTNDIWVTANFKETQVKRMRAGQSVTIHVDALAQDFDGYVEALPGASGAVYSLLPPENATGNYVKVVQRLPVRIRFKPGQPGEERLAPGMSVEPKVWID